MSENSENEPTVVDSDKGDGPTEAERKAEEATLRGTAKAVAGATKKAVAGATKKAAEKKTTGRKAEPKNTDEVKPFRSKNPGQSVAERGRKPRNDVTGRKAQEAAEAHAAEQQEAAQRMGMMTAVAVEDDDDAIIDYATAPEPDEAAPIIADQTEVVEVRARETVTDLTFGAGRTYDFKAGKTYHVTRALAEHLAEKNLIW